MASERTDRRIVAGQWRHLPHAADYRAALIGEMLVERVVWGPGAEAVSLGRRVIGGPGYIWFRFWLPREEQIVDKYFDPAGRPVGIQVDVCGPLTIEPEEWSTVDLLLDLWIDPDGRVTVRNEEQFERAVATGELAPEEASHAEAHIRQLTLQTAQGRFPPPLVRNWQVDVRRVREMLQGT